MKIGIRADGNSQIGMGHLQRCLSIAKVVKRNGDRCIFYVADQNSNEVVQKEGFQSIVLDSRWDDLDTEIPVIKESLLTQGVKCLLLDTYFITQEYLRNMQSVCKIAYIDDLFECIFPYNMLINYALYSGEFHYGEHYSESTKLLLGTKYVPLREQFQETPPREIKESVDNLLIVTGGADFYNLAFQLTKELLECGKYPSLKINVVCGKFSKQFEELMELQCRYPNVQVLYDVNDMASLMLQADIAISASGTTLYELSATGTPFICFTVADNQLKNAQSFSENDLAFYAGDARNGIERLLCRIDEQLEKLLYDFELRRKISSRLQTLVDGYGARRIAAQLTEL